MRRRLADDPEATELLAAGEAIIAVLTTVEGAIYSPHAEVDYDVLGGRHGGAQLWDRLSWLFNTARDHDGPPTQGMTEVAAELENELAAQESAIAGLLDGDLVELNALANAKGVPYVVTPGR